MCACLCVRVYVCVRVCVRARETTQKIVTLCRKKLSRANTDLPKAALPAAARGLPLSMVSGAPSGGEMEVIVAHRPMAGSAPHCTALQHTAPYCNTLLHTTTHCNTLPGWCEQAHCSAMHKTATHCTTPHHTATPCTTLHHTHGRREPPYCSA